MAKRLRQLVWTILSLFVLSFWVNVSMLIEWSSLTDNIGIEVNRCHQQMNLCRHRYPLLQDPTVHSAGTMFTGPDWNTSAVGDDADSSVSTILLFDLLRHNKLEEFVAVQKNCFYSQIRPMSLRR